MATFMVARQQRTQLHPVGAGVAWLDGGGRLRRPRPVPLPLCPILGIPPWVTRITLSAKNTCLTKNSSLQKAALGQ